MLMMTLMILCGGQVSALDLDLIFVVEGDTLGENMGYGVHSPGDLDGDGYSEVFVASYSTYLTKVFNGGNPADSEPIWTFAGPLSTQAWIPDISGNGQGELCIRQSISGVPKQMDVYFGGPELYTKTEPDLIIYPNDEEDFWGTVRADDYDADGHLELIIQAAQQSPYAVRYYIYETYPELDSVVDDSLTIANQVFTSSCIGDINGDGYADYATAPWSGVTPGYVLVSFGSADLDSIPDLQIWSPFNDSSTIGNFGYSIVPAGNLNWDAYADFIVTSTGFPPCIFYGGDPIDTIPKILEHPGQVANTCGDINHDGWEDIAVGYPSYGFGNGLIRVYFGARDMDTIADITIGHWELNYAVARFGKSVGPAGDFNGDGVDDLAVGSHEYDVPHWNKGRLWVFAGSDTLPLAADDAEEDRLLPKAFNLLKQNYPNPFNHKTMIQYSLFGHSERQVELLIYNILGERISTLVSDHQPGGDHTTWWDGTDNSGDTVPSGIYFYVLKADGQRIVKKMLFLK